MEIETFELLIFKENTINCFPYTNQVFYAKRYNFPKVLGGLVSGYFAKWF